MGKLGFYFDQTRCIGCRTCQIACKDKNDLSVGVLYRHVRSFEQGDYPNPGYFHYSWNCNHCETPACVTICPVGAMHIDSAEGTVQPNNESCIGCGYCVEACPYKVPILLDTGVAGKCDACIAWRQKGENCICVDACLMRCLDFGDIDELKAKYGEGLVNELSILPSANETTPSLLVNPRLCALDADFTEKAI
jgi:anaerobic dimethyl sulfoxide reductase subunit B (iron-sulfur subunit)